MIETGGRIERAALGGGGSGGGGARFFFHYHAPCFGDNSLGNSVGVILAVVKGGLPTYMI